MIYIFYGEQRGAIDQEIKKLLGSDYEAFDGDKIDPANLPELFLGTSLFAEQRKIVVRDLLTSGVKPEMLLKFTGTPHQIVLVETKFNRTTTAAKQLAKSPQVTLREFKAPVKNTRAVFDVFTTAQRDGVRAVKLLDSIIEDQEPQRFLGLLASQVIKAYAARPTPKNKRILQSLAQLDLELKTSGLSGEPWLLIKSWLLQISRL